MKAVKIIVPVCLMVVAGCNGGDSAEVVHLRPAEPQHKETWPIALDDPYVISIANVCVQGGSEAVITSVELVDAEGIEVVDFAVTPGVSYAAGSVADLDDIHAGHDKTIKAVCDGTSLEPTAIAAVNVQVGRTTIERDSTSTAYKINWSSEGRSGSFVSLLGLSLCNDCSVM